MPAQTMIERPTGLVVPETRHLAATFIDPPEIRESDAGDGSYKFVGHAAVWNRLSVDLGGFRERILRGAFTAILDDHANLDAVLVADHGLGALTTVASTRGGTLELSEDAKGLRVYADVAPTTVGADLKILMQRGDVQGMSFGFRVADGGDSWAEENGEVIRTIRSMGALIDVSIVSFPAYPQTDVSVRSALLVERRDRLDLYDGTTGDVDAAEVARVRARVQARTLELTPEQQRALDMAATKINQPQETATVRSIATETDLRHAITRIGRSDCQDDERARIIARADELNVRGLIPSTWAQDGTLSTDATLTTEQRETYNDTYQALAAALDDLLVDNGDFYYVWVQDFTDTEVIFSAGGDLWSAPYTLTPGGPVTVGDPVNVRPVTEYVPMDTAGLPAETVGVGGERAAARDALERRLRAMKLQAEL